MKAQVAKYILLSLMIGSLSAGTVNNAVAMEKPAAQKTVDTAADIRYTGFDVDFLRFEFTIRQPATQRFVMRIVDQNGLEIHRETFNGREFSRVIKVQKNDYSRLNFIIDTQAGQYRKSFSIQSEVTETLNVMEVSAN